MRVIIKKHAYERYAEYKGPIKITKLSSMVRRHLHAALRQGVSLENAAIQLEIFHDLNAVVVPGNGCWDVVTFYATIPEKVDVAINE